MPGIEKLLLEDALEDAPQTRSLLSVFEDEARQLHDFTRTMHELSSRLLNAQNEMCTATQSLSAHIKTYNSQKFVFESDDSILSSTLVHFSSFLDEISSMHQILASQLADSLLYPLTKFLQADLEEVVQMSDLYKVSGNDYEQSLNRYMKFPKKKDGDQKARQDTHEDLCVYRRKFHQRALHLYSSLNTLQYKRKISLLEPLIGYLQSYKGYFDMGKAAIVHQDTDEFLSNISTSIQGVQLELASETKRSVEMIDNIEKKSSQLYRSDSDSQTVTDPVNLNLSQKAGYLYMRSKQGLITSRWDRCYFFIQGGNLMYQPKDEVAGSLILDLNQPVTVAEVIDCDDRRYTFHVVSGKKVVVLQAENSSQRDEWIATINNEVVNGSFAVGEDVESSQARRSDASSSARPPAVINTATSVRRDPAVGSPTKPMMLSSPGGFFPDAPISFDLASPSDEPQSTTAFVQLHSSGVSDITDLLIADSKPAISKRFNVRFLGSMTVNSDRGEPLILETIRQVMAARAIHNVFRMTESVMVVSSSAVRLVDPSSKNVRSEFGLEDISYWSVHQENPRLFGLISRTRAEQEGSLHTFSCHVFECNESGEEICIAIQLATKEAYKAVMRERAIQEQKFIEEQILLANIQKLTDKPSSEPGPTEAQTAPDTDPTRVTSHTAETAQTAHSSQNITHPDSSNGSLKPEAPQPVHGVSHLESNDTMNQSHGTEPTLVSASAGSSQEADLNVKGTDSEDPPTVQA